MLFGKPAPARVPTDTVVPLPFFDDAAPWKNFILYTMFVFDDVLDPQKLRSSLEALAQRDGWRKLGARLRRNANGDLVYHVPASFSADRRPLAFSHVEHAMPAAQHPVASKLPKPSSRPAVVGDPDDFQPLFHREGAPVKLDDYLMADIPQLGLHVVSFSDKTVVTLSWPHTMMDAMGKRALLDAWTRSLDGRLDAVAAPHGGVDFSDPLATLGTQADSRVNSSEPYLLADHRLSMLGLAAYGLSNISNFVRAQENRMVCVPAAFVRKLQVQADDDLAAMPPAEDKPVFVSEGDVLCAWWTRMATVHLARSDGDRTVVLNNAFSLRKPLTGHFFAAPDASTDGRVAYISNAVGFVFALLPARDVFTLPLGCIAARIRRAVELQRTPPQIEAFYHLWRHAPGRLPPMVGNRSMHMITFSNWCKAQMYDADLSAAIVSKNGHSNGAAAAHAATATATATKPGRPVYVQNNQFGLILPDGFPIIGKDAGGNVWLSGYMNPGVWAQIEAELDKYA